MTDKKYSSRTEYRKIRQALLLEILNKTAVMLTFDKGSQEKIPLPLLKGFLLKINEIIAELSKSGKNNENTVTGD